MSFDEELSPDEKRAINGLKNLARIWPKSLWVFATGSGLHVMKCGPKGDRMYDKKHEGVDQDFLVENIDIPNDGGDW